MAPFKPKFRIWRLLKMVDTTEAMESQYLTADIVKGSPTKKCVIVDGGSYEDTVFGTKRLTLKVSIDGKQKIWRPNRDSVKNLRTYGVDTTNWVGKTINLQIISIQGKDSIIATIAHESKPVTETKVE